MSDLHQYHHDGLKEQGNVDIIEKLDGCSQGRREFDFAIMGMIVGPELVGDKIDRDDFGCWWDDKGKIYRPVPHFTTSIDAALQLVPKNACWEVMQRCSEDSPMRHFGASGLFRASVGWGDKEWGLSDTAPVALCLAALRYRGKSSSKAA